MLTPHRTLQMVATAISFSTTGQATIIAASAGQVTSAYRMHLTAAGAVVVTVQSASTTVDTITFTGSSAPLVLGYEEEPYYQTGANQALNFSLSSAVSVTGQIHTITCA